MSIAEDFAALIAERPALAAMIDNIRPLVDPRPSPLVSGCTYLFDGYMICHIVFWEGRYRDVQDQDDPMWDIRKFTAYDSVLSIVLNMEELFHD